MDLPTHRAVAPRPKVESSQRNPTSEDLATLKIDRGVAFGDRLPPCAAPVSLISYHRGNAHALSWKYPRSIVETPTETPLTN